MSMFIACVLWLSGCWGDDAYIVKGVVVEVDNGEVVLDHETIDGLMPAMVMAFPVSDPAMLQGLEPGHRVVGRYRVGERGGQLVKLRITGKGPAPELARGPSPLRPGQPLPRHEVATTDGATVVIGEGQDRPMAITFIYTRCPIAEYCPAMIGRFQALDGLLGDDEVGLLAITLDPAFDSLEVLRAYGNLIGAGERLRFGRVEPAVLDDLAMYAGMNVLRDADEIQHSMRMLVLDGEGRLVERYDDARFPTDRVAEQLRTGAPHAPEGQSGTSTPRPE